MERPSIIEATRQQFWLSILTYLSLLIEHIDEENFVWLERAINFMNIIIDIDYPDHDLDIYTENLLDAYHWFHGAQSGAIENVRQRILQRIINFLAEEMGNSAGFRLQSIHSALQNLEQLLDLQQAAGDYEDTSDLLEVYFKYRAHILNMTGNQLVDLNFLPVAVGEYTDALILDPTNLDFYCNRASAYIALEQYASAAADCQECIDLDATCARAFVLLGNAHYERGWFFQARSAYRNALIIDPTNEAYTEYLKLAEVQLYPKTIAPLPPLTIDVDNLLNDATFAEILNQISPDPEVMNEFTDLIRQSSAGGYANYDVLIKRLNVVFERQSTPQPELLAYLKQRALEQQPSTSAQAVESVPSTSGPAIQQETITSNQSNGSTFSQDLEEYPSAVDSEEYPSAADSSNQEIHPPLPRDLDDSDTN